MAFLTALAAQIGEWALTQLYAIIKKDIATAEAQVAEQKQATAEAAALTSATTPAEVQNAAQNSLNNL